MEAAVIRQVGVDARDFVEAIDGIGLTRVHVDRPPHRVLVAETGAGQGLADDHRMWLVEGSGGIALKEVQREHGYPGGVCIEAVCFYPFVTDNRQLVHAPADPAAVLYARYLGSYRTGHFSGDIQRRADALVRSFVLYDPVDVVVLGKIVIESELILHPEQDEGGAGDADGESGDVEETERTVFPETAEGCSE